jgi:hypothetical protein
VFVVFFVFIVVVVFVVVFVTTVVIIFIFVVIDVGATRRSTGRAGTGSVIRSRIRSRG